MKQRKEPDPQHDAVGQTSGGMAAGRRTLTDQLETTSASAPVAAAVGGGGARAPVQLKLRDDLRDQHDKRGKNPAAGPGGGTQQSFSDMARDDKGPTFHHDHGFLDDGHGNIDESKRQDPTWGDRVER